MKKYPKIRLCAILQEHHKCHSSNYTRQKVHEKAPFNLEFIKELLLIAKMIEFNYDVMISSVL